MDESPRRRPIHPFPARMAPEVALDKIQMLTEPGDVVLDPMCGSGTVVGVAVDNCRKGIGADLDPLAVILTRASCVSSWSDDLETRAEEVIRRARKRSTKVPRWITSDPDTDRFVNFWFAPKQIEELSQLARVLNELPRKDDALRIALSRLIITKDKGASLARDTSHSRPHRVRDTNDFDVFAEYIRSARRIELLTQHSFLAPRCSVRRSDARSLTFLANDSVDLVVTSPPYLNAIDYLRGHRMSLVWLGWSISQLRGLRGETIGSERAPYAANEKSSQLAEKAVTGFRELSRRQQQMVLRFTQDIDRMSGSLGRVVKPGGHVVLVVADSQLTGVPIQNSTICKMATLSHGFELSDRQIRSIPASHRYLPPPNSNAGALGQRMRQEVVFTFRKIDETA
jgi:methylase of polypeptide subunit release factors